MTERQPQNAVLDAGSDEEEADDVVESNTERSTAVEDHQAAEDSKPVEESGMDATEEHAVENEVLETNIFYDALLRTLLLH